LPFTRISRAQLGWQEKENREEKHIIAQKNRRKKNYITASNIGEKNSLILDQVRYYYDYNNYNKILRSFKRWINIPFFSQKGRRIKFSSLQKIEKIKNIDIGEWLKVYKS